MRKPLPKRVQFLLAESVREEVGGKLTLLGYFTGNDIIMHNPMPATIPKGAKGIALSNLTILATFFGGSGTYNAEVAVYDPSGKSMLQPRESLKYLTYDVIAL